MSNNAENLVQIINNQRHFEGIKLGDAKMVWKCSTPDCPTKPVIRAIKAYSHRMLCNTCSNRKKAQDPELLKRRGQAISKSISNLGDKWSIVATANNSRPEQKAKISQSMLKYIDENREEAIEIRRKTAISNNSLTGFGTSDFARNMWANMSTERKAEIFQKISEENRITGKKEHLDLMNNRFPDFTLVEYTGFLNTYQCSQGHQFVMLGNNFLKRGVCTVCAPKSKLEMDMFKWYHSIEPKAQSGKRVLFLDETSNGNKALEVDIFDPTRRLGIEVHGLFYHKTGEDKYCKEYKYHQTKKELADINQIKLLQFFEDELLCKEDIVKSIIKSKAGIYDRKIFARKTTIKTVTKEEKNAFLEKNHLQGTCKSRLNLGLFIGEELLSILTFRKKEENIEIARFSNKLNTTVVGGFARLLKHSTPLLKQMGFNTIVTYSDRRYSDGELYKNNGFEFKHHTAPDMFWTKKYDRFPRQISWGKTNEQMREEKFHQIHGAGHSFWIKNI